MLPDDKQKNSKDTEEKIPAVSFPQNEHVKEAHDQAEADIEQDPDLSLPTPGDDLDEGESARLNDDENDLI